MSHFAMTVALPAELAGADALHEALTAVLAPFDENLEVPRYVEHTRESLIAKGRKEIEDYRAGTYSRYLDNPADYAAKCTNPTHLAYLMGADEDGGFPAKLTWTDEQVYADQISWYEKEDIGAEGEVYSEYNPKSEWDWWIVGGRWAHKWALREGCANSGIESSVAWCGSANNEHPLATDCARVRDIDPELINGAWGYVTLEGEWVEKGNMGWWGMSDADDSTEGEIRWKKSYLDWIASLPADTWIVNVDCHI